MSQRTSFTFVSVTFNLSQFVAKTRLDFWDQNAYDVSIDFLLDSAGQGGVTLKSYRWIYPISSIQGFHS